MGSRRVDWVPPERFDEYRRIKALGRGSMGQVWLAHDTVLDRLVAVKFIAPLSAHDAVRHRFLVEARALARVQHPNIIAVFRVGEIDSRPYLISEYVRGESLDKLPWPVAWPRLLEIAVGLTRGLAAAHRQGVLHRDLKPANAIVSDLGEVKLLDFGLAKLLPHIAPHSDEPTNRVVAAIPGVPGLPTSGPRTSSESFMVPAEVATDGSITLPEGTPPGRNPAIDPVPLSWPSVTRAGAVLGTPAYMSPEAWLGEPATPRSDVYALGAMLYALGAGAPPHRGDGPELVRRAVLAGDAPPLAVAAPGIDARFATVVDRCLRRDPAERFASGDEVREALEALDASGKTVTSMLARLPRNRSSPRWRRAVLISAAVALALISALVLTFCAYHNVVTPVGCPEGMVPVPAGTFLMGRPEREGDPRERPQHEVTLSEYCIDRTEVTVAAYSACVAAGGCNRAPQTVNWTGYSGKNVKAYSSWCNREDRPDHPINCVDWDQAAAYCAWRSKRLPTEAEWEYAARGSDGRAYPWGNEAPSTKLWNVCDSECVATVARQTDTWPAMYEGNDGWGETAPVGSYPEGRSPFGVLDMAGNVWEWTADWYGAYTTQAETNPQGPSAGTSRVARGGGWMNSDANRIRATRRTWRTPPVRDCDLGFRCAHGN